MLSQDVAVLDYYIRHGEHNPPSVDAWERIKAALAESPNSSHNTGSPKLPTLLEAVSGALGFKVSEFPNTDTGLAMKDMYDYICRQLRASA